MTIEIKKIIINIDGQELKLTAQQAKELRRVLDELVEKETIYPYYPYPIWPWYPTITWTADATDTYIITADNQTVIYGNTITSSNDN